MEPEVRVVPVTEILGPDGRARRPERRARPGPFRPYAPPRPCPEGVRERRRRPRPPGEPRRGERLDLRV